MFSCKVAKELIETPSQKTEGLKPKISAAYWDTLDIGILGVLDEHHMEFTDHSKLNSLSREMEQLQPLWFNDISEPRHICQHKVSLVNARAAISKPTCQFMVCNIATHTSPLPTYKTITAYG